MSAKVHAEEDLPIAVAVPASTTAVTASVPRFKLQLNLLLASVVHVNYADVDVSVPLTIDVEAATCCVYRNSSSSRTGGSSSSVDRRKFS